MSGRVSGFITRYRVTPILWILDSVENNVDIFFRVSSEQERAPGAGDFWVRVAAAF